MDATPPNSNPKWPSLRATGLLLVVCTALISGVSTFVNAGAVRAIDVSSDPFVTVRNVLVAAMLVPMAVLLTRGSRERLTGRQWLRLAAIGLFGGAIPFLLFFRGLALAREVGGAAAATFGFRTLFLMTAVLAVVFLKERVSLRLLAAMGLLLLGSALLISFTGPIWTAGTALVLAATAMWAAEYTLSKHTLRDLRSGTVAAGRMGFGGLFLLGYLVLTGGVGQLASFGVVQWQWVALSAVLLVGFVSTWYAGLKHVDLSVAASVLVLATPITLALDILLAGRALTLPVAAGVVSIVAGVVLAIGAASLREMWIHLAATVRSRIRTRVQG